MHHNAFLYAYLLCAYQSHWLVVHVNIFLSQGNLLNLESHTRETQLSCDVHPPKFHVHSNYLHGTYTSEIEGGTHMLGHFPLTTCQAYRHLFFFYKHLCNLQKEMFTCARPLGWSCQTLWKVFCGPRCPADSCRPYFVVQRHLHKKKGTSV